MYEVPSGAVTSTLTTARPSSGTPESVREATTSTLLPGTWLIEIASQARSQAELYPALADAFEEAVDVPFARLQLLRADARIENRVEAYAPGFRELVIGRATMNTRELTAYNANYIGGDFSAGLMDLRGLLRRPVLGPVPWRTPLRGVYLCSSSTPPGPGVTGMPGFHAARYALKDIFGLAVPALSA